MNERRHDIDWLRVQAIGLLLLYHMGIGFQSWGVFFGFIQNQTPLDSLWVPMSMLNIWRIPLLFFVSGMGVCFAMARRSWKALIIERTRRILLPLVFGSLCIVPLHLLLWQGYYKQDLAYAPGMGHLWFLGNIFVYVVVLSPLFFHLKKHEEGRTGAVIRKILGSPLVFLLVAAAFVSETMLLRPESYSLYAMTLHGWVLGALAFLFGFLFVYGGESFLELLRRWTWPLAGLAVILFLLRYLVFDLEAPGSLKALETCSWVFTLLALANRYLNRPGKVLRYLSRAAYPVYILHMVFLYLGSSLLMPLGMDPWITFLLVLLFTTGGCMLTYEFLVRRLSIVRVFFGLNPGR